MCPSTVLSHWQSDVHFAISCQINTPSMQTSSNSIDAVFLLLSRCLPRHLHMLGLCHMRSKIPKGAFPTCSPLCVAVQP